MRKRALAKATLAATIALAEWHAFIDSAKATVLRTRGRGNLPERPTFTRVESPSVSW